MKHSIAARDMDAHLIQGTSPLETYFELEVAELKSRRVELKFAKQITF